MKRDKRLLVSGLIKMSRGLMMPSREMNPATAPALTTSSLDLFSSSRGQAVGESPSWLKLQVRAKEYKIRTVSQTQIRITLTLKSNWGIQPQPWCSVYRLGWVACQLQDCVCWASGLLAFCNSTFTHVRLLLISWTQNHTIRWNSRHVMESYPPLRPTLCS